MMVRWLKYILFFLFVAMGSLWIGVQLPSGQRFVKSTCERLIRSFGLEGSIEHVDVAFPFLVRFQGIVIKGPVGNDRPMVTCQQLSVSPLLFDLPLGRITFLNVQGNGLSVDGDALEAFIAKTAPATKNNWSFAIERLHLTSLHVTSQRLPNEENSLDCSIRGRLHVSKDSCKLSCSLSRNIPSLWPKRLDITLGKYKDDYNANACIFLTTEGLPDRKKLLFGPKDRLDIALKANGSLETIVGSWTLVCPQFASPLYQNLVLKQSTSGRGTFAYQRNTSLTIDCEEAEKSLTLERLPPTASLFEEAPNFQPQTSTTFYRATFSTCGHLTCTPNKTNGIQAKLSLPSCSLNNIPGSLSAILDLSDQEGQITTTISAEGRLQKGTQVVPLQCQANVQSDDDGWSITADLFATPFRGIIDCAVTTSSISGRGTLRCQDLSVFEGIIPAPLSGSAELSAAARLEPEGSRYSLTANLSDFHWQDLECQNGTIRFLRDQSPSPLFSFHADLIGARSGALLIGESHTVLSYDPSSLQLNLLEANVNGQIHGLPFSLLGTGEGRSSPSDGLLTINHLQGAVAEYTLALDQPIRIGHKDRALSLLSGALRVGTEGRIAGEWHSAAPHRVSGDLTFERIPLGHLMAAVNGPLAQGNFNGQFNFQSTPRDFSANASMQATIARFGVLGGIDGGLALGSTFTIEENEATTQTCIAGMGIKEPLLINLSVPVSSVSGWPFISVDPQAPLRGTIKGDIRLTQLLGGWLPEQAGFEAIIGCDALLSGTVQDPYLKGPAHVREGQIDLLPTGEVIKDIEMDGTLENRTLSLHRIEASDEKQGHVTGTGLVEITPSNDFHWQATLDCSNVEAISLDYATASADGTIKLEGDLSGMTISGSAIARKALIDLAARFPVDTPDIPFTYVGEKPSGDTPFLVNFDLSVDAASGVEIRGRGLSSQWKGHLHLGGEASQLVLDGNLRCLEGSFCLSNKELTISEGVVSVAGDLFHDSRLNVIANIDLPAITADVCLKGSLENPKISIQSNPPRPDTEILSLILFNKEFGDISPLQSLQLANTALTLQHPSGPFGFVDRMKENLGIDLIDVGSQAPGVTPTLSTTPSALDPSDTGPPPPQLQNDVSIKVGKYISDGVAVTVSKDVGSDTNYVGFEAQLAPEVSAEAQVGADQIGVVSLKWKKNY
jgi:hypothetical protein